MTGASDPRKRSTRRQPPNERARERRRLIDRAGWMRAHPTDAERKLWRQLRCRQVDGYKFRRQARIAGYVVDFACFQARLVIEVDGGQHAEPEQRRWDTERSARLSESGFRMLRFWNHEVLQQLDAVLEVIHHDLHRWEQEQRPQEDGPLP